MYQLAFVCMADVIEHQGSIVCHMAESKQKTRELSHTKIITSNANSKDLFHDPRVHCVQINQQREIRLAHNPLPGIPILNSNCVIQKTMWTLESTL